MSRSGKYVTPSRQTILYGTGVATTLQDVLNSLKATRAVVVTNTSLAGAGGVAQRVAGVLGDKCVRVVAGVRAHPPREDVVRLARELRECRADVVVAVGGGSVCDATKVARVCLANEVSAVADLDRLRIGNEFQPPRLPYVVVPTTLSAGEYTQFAGVTDERGPRKEVYTHPVLAPDVVVLDPEVARGTPARLWFSTGIRAVDHSVETWCSINATPHSDALSLHGLGLLVPALRRSMANRDDLEAVLDCQLGAWLSIQGFASGVELGGSHGIGHALGGTAGMPHGETSCVMLPHVLRYNAAVNEARQAELVRVMQRPGESAGDAVAELVGVLGMPQRLRDAGVSRDLLDQVASEAIHDPWVKTNPRPIDGVPGIRALLETAW